jgi:hypothetical protein
MNQPAQEAEVVQVKPEDFAKHYEQLCQKDGYVIVPSLVWLKRDDGSWSTTVNLTIGQVPKEK